jgi:hypothetical protein
MDVEKDTYTAVMHEIPEGGPYTFVVTARNEIGVGPSSQSVPVEVSVAYCNSCGNELPDDHFMCTNCKNRSCIKCRSPLGPCLSCNPYQAPGSPANVNVDFVRQDATVSWSEPAFDGGKPIIEYIVGVEELPGKHVKVKEGTSAVIDDLPAGVPYTFTVTASNEIGVGPQSESVQSEIPLKSCDICRIILDGDPVSCDGCEGEFGPECIDTSGLCINCHANALPGSPDEVNVELLPKNLDDLEVSWQPPDHQGDSPVTEYLVRCVEDPSITVSADASSFARKYCPSCGDERQSSLPNCMGCGTTYPAGSDEKRLLTTTVHLPTIGQSYSFTVSAINSTGEGPLSAPSNPIRFAQQKMAPLVEQLLPGEMCTIAGNGRKGDSGDGGLAVGASLNEPYDVALDEQGNVYIADSANHKIRKISIDTGIIETEVGTGTAGFAGDGGDPGQAQLNQPRGIDFDSLGNLYIADRENCRVRRVDSGSDLIETIAGNGVSGNEGDGQPAQLGQLCHPESVSVDRTTGRIYIAGGNGFSENDKKRVRVVDGEGVLRTFAGSEDAPKPQDGVHANNVSFSNMDDLVIAADSNGNVFVGEQSSSRLYMVSCETGAINTICGIGSTGSFGGDGLALETTIAPQGLAFYAADNVVFVNDGGSVWLGNKRIRKLDLKSGMISTVSGSGKAGFKGDGGPATSARFKKPRGLAVDSYGNLYIADTDNNRVRVIRKP